MRKLMTTVLMGLVLCASMSSFSLAGDFVYVTKSGKYYHKEGSRFIKNKEVEKLTRDEAEELGYKPSKEILKADQMTEEENPAM